MSLRTSLLAVIENVRGLAGDMGLRQYQVFVVVKSWAGARVGMGNVTTTETALIVSGSPPRVRALSQRDVTASGGRYVAGDLRVGPITPQHAGGGIAESVFNPPVGAQPTTVTFRVTGPNLPATGIDCERVGEETFGNFSHYLILRSTGRRAT
jgi:hypothetical protein